MNKFLTDLGLARRAKKLLLGTDQVTNSLKSTKVYLILVANDASSETINKMTHKCEYYNIPLNKSYSTDELCEALGMLNVKVVAVCDKGFYDLLKKDENM